MDDKNLKGWRAFLLKSWQPNPTVNDIICIFVLFGSILIIIGAILTTINMKIQEVTVNYGNQCETINQTCIVNFTIGSSMDAPVFLFYEIDNFYQNHRRYVRSKSLSQLAGESVGYSDVSTNCDPIIHVSDLQPKFRKNILGESLDNNSLANPCGLIANSYFDDNYTEFTNTDNQTKITINDTGITWPDDKGTKFKRNSDWQTVQWIDPENEHFIVWMRTAGLPTFRKLWGKISTDLVIGNYSMVIDNQFDISGFKGSKSFVLSTSGSFGGKNYFISIAYLVVGGICILISLFFFYKKKISGGNFGAIYKED